MDVQAEKLKWLNRAELEMLSDKSLSLHEREKTSESLRTVNSTWNKVCIKKYCHIFLIFIDFVVKEVGSYILLLRISKYGHILLMLTNKMFVVIIFASVMDRSIYFQRMFFILLIFFDLWDFYVIYYIKY